MSELSVDALLLVDGGSDSLLVGDEAGLGTPAEDMASIAAATALELPTKLLASIGFGVDAFHGVSHGHVLETVAAIAKSGGFLGSFSLLHEMEEFAFYESAHGDFGDVHRTQRTRGSTLWINPLMSLFFAFELEAVSKRIAYLPAIEHTQTMFEVGAIIEAYQKSLGRLRPRAPIPI